MTVPPTTPEAPPPIDAAALLDLIGATLDQLRTLIEQGQAPSPASTSTASADLSSIAARMFGGGA